MKILEIKTKELNDEYVLGYTYYIGGGEVFTCRECFSPKSKGDWKARSAKDLFELPPNTRLECSSCKMVFIAKKE